MLCMHFHLLKYHVVFFTRNNIVYYHVLMDFYCCVFYYKCKNFNYNIYI